MRYKAAVIGLGSIGAGYDYQDKNGARILTHSAGFNSHPGFELVAGVDGNKDARAKFEQKYNRPSFTSMKEMFKACSPDVVSIAVPTSLHYAVFTEAVTYLPKAILCEKPFNGNFQKAAELKQLADNNGIILLINYIRRFEPGVLRLKTAIDAGTCGQIYKGTLWYSKGILNNGSHFIDMLIFLFGEVKEISLLAKGIQAGNDPEPDIRIRFGDVVVYFLAGREDCFSIKELELIGTKGRINYSGGGQSIMMRLTAPNPTFPGYVMLAEEGTVIPTDLDHYQAYVTEALYRALEQKTLPESNGETALQTLSVVEHILRLYREARENA